MCAFKNICIKYTLYFKTHMRNLSHRDFLHFAILHFSTPSETLYYS